MFLPLIRQIIILLSLPSQPSKLMYVVMELGREDLDQCENDMWVYLHLLDAAFSITVEDAQGFFYHCGYI